jgi:ketosteroid isomerase-like protein
MGEQDNVQVVQQIYAAFGHGDIPAILSLVAEDVDWINPGAPAIPYAGQRRGRAQVAEFFAALDDSVQIDRFVLRDLIEREGRVMALGSWQGRVRANGRGFETDWAMLWVCEKGRVVQFRSYQDTAGMVSAFQPNAAVTGSTSIPAEEIDAFLETVDTAIELALDGKAVDGYVFLMEGLWAAQRARARSKPWASAIVECYRLILQRFVDLYELRHI